MKKELIINMIAQVFMFAVNLGISFFLVPYITKIIGVEAYGFVGLANDFVGYAQIITIAINSMAARFITIKIHENKIKEANKYYSSVVISNIIISVILVIISTIFVLFMEYFIEIPNDLIFDVKLLFSLVFTNFIVSILTSTFSIATFCTNKLYLTSIKTIISQILRVLVLFVTFMCFNPSVFYVGLASLVSTIYLGYCNYRYSKILTPDLKISKKSFNFKYIKTLISSGIWNTITKISSIISNGLMLLITNLFVGSKEMGIISLARTIPNLILNAFGTISSVFSPDLTISYAKKDKEGMKKQLLFSTKLLGLVSSIPLAILLAYGKSFFSLWVPNQNETLIYYLSCACVLEIIISLPLEPLWNIFTITDRVKYSSLFLLSNSIIIIILDFILLGLSSNNIYRMFIIVSVTSIISIIRSLTFLPLYGAKCLNLKLTTFYPSIIKNLIIVTLSTSLSKIIQIVISINSWIELFTAFAITTILTLILSIYIFLTKDERENILKKIYGFFKRNGSVKYEK